MENIQKTYQSSIYALQNQLENSQKKVPAVINCALKSHKIFFDGIDPKSRRKATFALTISSFALSLGLLRTGRLREITRNTLGIYVISSYVFCQEQYLNPF